MNASTASRDFQGESIDPLGIDDSYFIDNGWVDYEHDKGTIIGVPTSNCFTDSNHGLYVEAKLFKNNKYVQNIMKLWTNLKEVGSDRKIGFSIEGQINKRDSDDPTIIREVQITGVAVTTNPANPDATWDVVQKSRFGAIDKSSAPLTSGYGISPDTQVDGGALRPESLAGHITSLAYAIGQMKSPEKLMELGSQVSTRLEQRPRENKDVDSLFLQIFTGISRKDAYNILDSSNNDSKER